MTSPPPPGQEPVDGPGSFGGNGTPAAPPSPLPGDAITAQQLTKLAAAKSAARSKVARRRIPGLDPPTLAPTTCTLLFENAPLQMTGVELLDSYVIFRGGQNVVGPLGNEPCSSGGTGAWTTCCDHSPIIYLCNEFSNLSSSTAGLILIHEMLHVAGQREDSNSTTGPGNPPNTAQISAAVMEACSNPTVVY